MNGKRDMKITKLSWRNLWRNPTRTNVTILAVSLCIAVLIIFSIYDRGID